MQAISTESAYSKTNLALPILLAAWVKKAAAHETWHCSFHPHGQLLALQAQVMQSHLCGSHVAIIV